jgi:outer membrane protein assembly factor BamA
MEDEGGEQSSLLVRAAGTLVSPLPEGMLVKLPLLASDPNSGATIGFLPVWVLRDPSSGRIRMMHAPSITYNKTFGVTPTYRLYYFPTPVSELIARVSYSTTVNRDAVLQYTDPNLFDRGDYLLARIFFFRDGSERFFGFGPDSGEGAQSNYTQESLGYRFRFGLPMDKDSKFRIFAAHGLRFDTTENGPVPGIAGINQNFPGLGNQVSQQTTYFGLGSEYDTRDSGATTTKGMLVQTFGHYFGKSLGNEGEFELVGFDVRNFVHPADWFILATQVHAEHRFGYGIPFYDQAQLGGKYSLRGFGEGRFVDRGTSWVNVETRFLALKDQVGKFPIEVWLDPFYSSGTVYHDPQGITQNQWHNVVGLAFRAVARPQVVGSVDLGWGGEGTAIFSDINYSF